MRLLKSFLLTSICQMINLGAILVTRILMARTMGPAAYGGFGVGLNLTTVLYKLLSVGIVPATQFYGSKEISKDISFIKTILAVSLCVALAILLIGIGVVPWLLSSYWQKQPIGYQVYTTFALFLPFIILGDVLSILFIPLGRILNYNTVQLIGGSLMPVLFSLGLFFLVPMNSAVASQIAIWIIIFLYDLWFFRKVIFAGSFDKSLAHDMTSYGLKTWPNVLLNVGAARFAVLYGASIITEVQIGYYIVAMNVVDGIFSFHAVLGQFLLSRVSKQENESYGGIQMVMRISCVVLAMICLLYLCFGKLLVEIFFGKNFVQAFQISLIILIMRFAHALHGILSNFLAGMNMPTRNTFTLGSEMLLLFITVPLLTTRYGVYGLSWAAALSAILALSVSTYQSVIVMKCNIWDLYVLRRSDISKLFNQLKSLFSL